MCAGAAPKGRSLFRRTLCGAILMMGGSAAAAEPPQGVHAFVAAYPDFLARVEKGVLVWRDGTKMPLSALGLDRDSKPTRRFDAAPDPKVRATEGISAIDYEPIFLRMYGDCRRQDMAARLAPVQWNRAGPEGGVEIMAAKANGIATALQRVSDTLDGLGRTAAGARRSLGGTFNCRNIAGAARLSLHGFGIAIDVDPGEDGYWQTADVDKAGRPVRRNRVPPEVVAAFEDEGFVWGGRWNRFDTFHFEYRPEYRIAAGGTLPDRLTRPTFNAFFGGHASSAAVERMSFLPRRPGAPVCHRWVRQPGRNFGKCIGATIMPGKAPAQQQRQPRRR
ncbi:MAG: M15 family metallopeptidase [Alphaproteobacteria bacterium]